MNYNEYLKDLNENTLVTLYLCKLSEGKLFTFHSGEVFDSSIPDWMVDYVTGNQSLLPFEQDQKTFVYCRWILDNENMLIFIDDPDFSVQSKLARYLVCKPTVKDVVRDDSKEFDDLRVSYQKLRKSFDQYAFIIDDMKKEIESLREQNSDQALRLKKTLAENLLLTKNRNISEKNDPDELDMHQKDLSYVIKSLNSIISTGSAAHVNVDALATLIPVTSARELERNPELVKTCISRLIGMDRSGKLSDSELRKICEAFGRY